MGHGLSEARVVTHDGFIWPVERHAMRAHDAIRQRMAEDLKRLRDEAGENPVELTEAGWTFEQVQVHGLAAKLRLDREERDAAETEPKGFGLVRQFSRSAAELACLTAFLGAGLVIALHLTQMMGA
ncbi:hypothetical protein [Microvirga solisilvae]|uniref:hypothetical protein n=1 Tax=Microvirga solisilvae TaxID=2919498 RepID=UPI001FAF8966|nr:hypothetical protein [Microvirga solisilvae]